jgi:hypothetical protein
MRECGEVPEAESLHCIIMFQALERYSILAKGRQEPLNRQLVGQRPRGKNMVIWEPRTIRVANRSSLIHWHPNW